MASLRRHHTSTTDEDDEAAAAEAAAALHNDENVRRRRNGGDNAEEEREEDERRGGERHCWLPDCRCTCHQRRYRLHNNSQQQARFFTNGVNGYASPRAASPNGGDGDYFTRLFYENAR